MASRHGRRQHRSRANRSLTASAPDGAVSLIVQFRNGNLSRQIAQCRRAGARWHRSLPLVHGAAFSVPRNGLQRLRQSPEVISVSEEALVRQSMYDVTPAVCFRGRLDRQGVGVAIVDSGINVNTDFNNASRGRGWCTSRASPPRRLHSMSRARHSCGWIVGSRAVEAAWKSGIVVAPE